MSHLTLAMLTEMLIIFRTGGWAFYKLFPFSRFEHNWKRRDCLCLSIKQWCWRTSRCRVILTINVRFGFTTAVLSVFICNHRGRRRVCHGFSEVQEPEPHFNVNLNSKTFQKFSTIPLDLWSLQHFFTTLLSPLFHKLFTSIYFCWPPLFCFQVGYLDNVQHV